MPRTSPHFRTNRPGSRLLFALGISLALHLLPLAAERIFAVNRPSTAKMPALQAELRPLPRPQPAVPLTLPDPPQPESPPPKPAPPKPLKPPKPAQPEKAGKTPASWTQVVRQHLQKLDAAGQFYPAEAIARGQQGTVDVLMVLDESGKVAAARVEQGSGFPLLDEAAVRAVRSLTSLPADAPRQIVLPVRFRLR